MKPTPILILLLLFVSCTREESGEQAAKRTEYDIFPVIDQSNAYNGLGFDYSLGVTDPCIQQLGAFDSNNYKFIASRDQLEHHSLANGRNGFAITFAMNYLQYFWEGNRPVLLIPAAMTAVRFTRKNGTKAIRCITMLYDV